MNFYFKLHDRESEGQLTPQSDLIEVIKKEIVEIRTTKIYFVKDRHVGQRTKIRVVENAHTVTMTSAELDAKLAKTDEKLEFVDSVEPETETETEPETTVPERKISVQSSTKSSAKSSVQSPD